MIGNDVLELARKAFREMDVNGDLSLDLRELSNCWEHFSKTHLLTLYHESNFKKFIPEVIFANKDKVMGGNFSMSFGSFINAVKNWGKNVTADEKNVQLMKDLEKKDNLTEDEKKQLQQAQNYLEGRKTLFSSSFSILSKIPNNPNVALPETMVPEELNDLLTSFEKVEPEIIEPAVELVGELLVESEVIVDEVLTMDFQRNIPIADENEPSINLVKIKELQTLNEKNEEKIKEFENANLNQNQKLQNELQQLNIELDKKLQAEIEQNKKKVEQDLENEKKIKELEKLNFDLTEKLRIENEKK